jgi:glycosyltransferase involved in cell wall biosynthesis
MKLAIVVPRYGQDILGGAETFARQLAEHLPRPEFQVEVLTTCASDLLAWRNVYPAGSTLINGVRVWRYPVDHRFYQERLYNDLTNKFSKYRPATLDEEYAWIDQLAHSPTLYEHIARWGSKYDLLIFVPYIFGTTLYGATLWPERSIIWPCLHDEPFAHFLQTRLMLASCRGIMFTTEPERKLAETKLGVHNPGAYVVGFGLDDVRGDAQRFRAKFGLHDPFMLYSGRFDSMKNLLELLRFFVEYKRWQPSPLKLVLMGEGPLAIPVHRDIISIGFQSRQDKLDAYAAATLLCQPSLMESFSIVIMESWLTGVPVLVNGDCDVTLDHVVRSNGGLYYQGFDEFSATVDWLMQHADECARMGQLGRAYVLREYNWNVVLDRFRAAVELWQRF